MLGKFFRQFVFLVAVIVFSLFMIKTVSAESMCCVSGNTCSLKTETNSCEIPTVGSDVRVCGPMWNSTDGSFVCINNIARISGEGYYCGPVTNQTWIDEISNSLSDGRRTGEVCIRVNIKEVPCSQEAFCRDELAASTDCSIFDSDRDLCLNNPNCFYDVEACYNRNNASICNRLSQRFCGTKSESGAIEGSLVCTWDTATNRCLTRVEQEMSSNFKYYDNSLLTPCAAKGNCRSVNDLLAILLKQTTIVFRLIGTAAFLFFVYGGFTIILSFGNPEKVQQGKQILTAAIIGIIIIFGAYILVEFILSTLGAAGFASTLF